MLWSHNFLEIKDSNVPLYLSTPEHDANVAVSVHVTLFQVLGYAIWNRDSFFPAVWTWLLPPEHFKRCFFDRAETKLLTIFQEDFQLSYFLMIIWQPLEKYVHLFNVFSSLALFLTFLSSDSVKSERPYRVVMPWHLWHDPWLARIILVRT